MKSILCIFLILIQLKGYGLAPLINPTFHLHNTLQRIFNKYLPEVEEISNPSLYKRRLHCLQVIKMHDAFIKQEFTKLIDYIPEKLKSEMSSQEKKEYLSELKTIYKKYYKNMDSLDRTALRIATILHDIGYFGGFNWEHNKRGARRAKYELKNSGLPEEVIERVYQLIYRHGDFTDITVDSFPEDILSINPKLKAGVFLITLFDCMGKPSGNILSLNKIRRLKNTEQEIISELNNKDFLNFRLKYIFSPTVFVDPSDWDQLAKDVRSFIAENLSEKDAAYVINLWNKRLKVNVFPIFKACAEHSSSMLAKLLITLALKVNLNTDSYITIDTDIDFMSLDDEQRKNYLEKIFSIMATRSIPDISLPVYLTNNKLVISLKELIESEKDLCQQSA